MIRSIQNYVRSIKIMKKGYKITNNGLGFIPEGTKVIAKEAFSQCTELTWVIIPDSVTEIEDLAFSDCTNLTDIILPNSLKKIGWCAFAGCTGLTEIKIPNSVETIDDRAFADCTGLTSITLPDTIEELKSWAFAGCTGLTNIVIPNSVKVINNAFTGCTGLTRIVIPDSVNLIDDIAFEGCTSLTIADFEGAVEEIGEAIFYECDHLAKILVPSGLTDYYKERLDEEVHNLIEEKAPVVNSITEHVLSITDTMTVGKFSHFFDYLFDGKAEIRIFWNKKRQLDEVLLKGLFNPNHAAELSLDSSITVDEAEKALSNCFIAESFVDIYPRNGYYRITKDMPLKDIRHLQAKL